MVAPSSPAPGPGVAFLVAIAALLIGNVAIDARADRAATVHVPAGSYVPLYATSSADRGRRARVDAFVMDVRPVTNAEFLAFVRARPEWRRSRVSRGLADETYLKHWQDDLVLGDRTLPDSPVVNVSWFAARAYLASVGKRLPTTHEWEYSATPALRSRTHLPGPVQEWIEDFNAALVTGESRSDGSLDRSLFCGSGAVGAADVSNYPAFMRYAFRASLEGRYGLANLGFRGVRAHAGTVKASRLSHRPDSRTSSIYAADIPLVDADGTRLTLSDLRGRPLVVSMVYTSCQSVCPTSAEQMKSIERRLTPADRAGVTFAMFSLDPGRDTPEALRAFSAAHQLDTRTWRLFATSESNVRTLSALLGVRYQPGPGGVIGHSSVVAVIDRNGAVRHRQSGVSIEPGTLVAALGDLVR